MQPVIKHCALCGKEVMIYYHNGSTNLKFCSTAHKDEYHSIFPLSQSRLNILQTLDDNGASYLPYTDTVMRMAGNIARSVAMIRLVKQDSLGKKYEITIFGKKVLDKHNATVYTE